MGCAREVETAPLPSALPVPRPPPDACNGVMLDQCVPRDGMNCQPLYYGSACHETHYLECVHGHYAFCESDVDCPDGSHCRQFLGPECPTVEVGANCNSCAVNVGQSCMTDAQYALVPHPSS